MPSNPSMQKPLSVPFSNNSTVPDPSSRDFGALVVCLAAVVLGFSSTAFDVGDLKLSILLLCGGFTILAARSGTFAGIAVAVSMILSVRIFGIYADRSSLVEPPSSIYLWGFLGLASLFIAYKSPHLRALGMGMVRGPFLAVSGIVILGRLSAGLSRGVLSERVGFHDELLLILVVLLGVLTVQSGWSKLKGFIAALAVSGTVISLVAIVQCSGISIAFPGTDKAVSLLGNTNHVGLFLAPIAVLCTTQKNLPIFLGGVLSLSGVVLSQSRGAALAVLIGWVVSLLWSRMLFSRGSIRPAVSLVCALTLGVLVSGVDVLAFKSIDESQESILSKEYPSNLIRSEVLKDTWEMCQEAPLLGHGPGSFRATYPAFQSEVLSTLPSSFNTPVEVADPHNDFAWLASERGIPAAFLWLLALLMWLRSGWKASRLEFADGKEVYAPSLSGAMASIAALSMTQTVLQQGPALILISLFGGLLLTFEEEGLSRSSLLNRLSGWGVSVALLAILWSGVFGMESQVSLAKLGKLKEISSRSGWKSAREHLEHALAADPSHLDAARSLAEYSTIKAMGTKSDVSLIDDATRDLARLIRLTPNDPWCFDQKGRLALKQHSEEEAKMAFRRAARLAPYGPSAERRMMEAETFLREQDLFMTTATEVELGELTVDRASLLHRRGESGLSKQILGEILKVDPADGDALHTMALILRDEGNDIGSEIFFYRAQIVFAIEWVLQGRMDEAKESLGRAKRYVDDRTEITVLKALVDFLSGDRETALSALEDVAPIQTGDFQAISLDAISPLVRDPECGTLFER